MAAILRPIRVKASAIAYIRTFIFGVEDSLVSTVGLLSGIAIAEVPRRTIFVTGVVLLFVEALSMAAGSFLSEHTAEDYAQHREAPARTSTIVGLIMFLSYLLAGLIPLSPYLFASVSVALPLSITLSLIALFGLGLIGGKLSGISMLRQAIQMALIGGSAIAVGTLAGLWSKNLL